ncbi:MAG: hypothetical protein ACI33S_03890 [Bacilli bacterium]
MQSIDILDVVVLDEDKHYVVASKVVRKNKNYYQLANVNDAHDTMICYQDKDELVEIHDKELIALLVPLFLKNLSDKLQEEEF